VQGQLAGEGAYLEAEEDEIPTASFDFTNDRGDDD